jgi:hypothetical protein
MSTAAGASRGRDDNWHKKRRGREQRKGTAAGASRGGMLAWSLFDGSCNDIDGSCNRMVNTYNDRSLGATFLLFNLLMVHIYNMILLMVRIQAPFR